MFGFKLFTGIGIAIAVSAAFAMFIQNIKAGERARIELALQKQREKLADAADESYDIANAKLANAERELQQQKDSFSAWYETQNSGNSCVITDEFRERLLGVGASGTGIESTGSS